MIARPYAEPAARLLELEQRAVAEAEERAAQDVDECQLILRIGQGSEQNGERFHLGGFAEGTGAADLDRDVQLLERTRVRCNPLPSSCA